MSRIMVVDDEMDIRFVIRKMLEKEGYEVIEADSGEQAMELLKDTVPDMILLDVMMPGLNGWETCEQIKSSEDLRQIPVVMLTAKTTEEDKVKALEKCGAQWHISKPLERSKFIETVKWLLESPPWSDE